MIGRMTTHEGLSLRIRQQMLARQMTQRELAAAIGLDPSGLSARFRGVRDFRLSELEAIAEELGIPLRDLLPETGEVQK